MVKLEWAQFYVAYVDEKWLYTEANNQTGLEKWGQDMKGL